MPELSIAVPGHRRKYDIHIGHGLIEHLDSLLNVDKYSKLIIVTDENTHKLWFEKVRSNLSVLPAVVVLKSGESSKNLDSLQKIWNSMRDNGLDRYSLVVILGGGVIGDLAGFAASTYMRGVDFAQIPTTLLAQVDSSVGGKTGFNFDNVKNLIGTFTQPSVVVIDNDTLSTLPERELVAGFAEMFKHGLIKDASYFEKLSRKKPAQFNSDEMSELIFTSVNIKASIVMADERETGERKLVNFGHTVGHAVEALSWETKHQLLHGEAIAIGMAVEADLSVGKGFISAGEVDKIRHVLTNTGLPTKIPNLPIDKLISKMNIDKKNDHGRILFTLLQQIGKAVYNQTVDDAIIIETLERNMA